MPLGQHICLRLADNRVIAPTPHERRVVASVVLEQGRAFDLLAFGLADTHPHLLTPRSREEAGELARRVEISLVRRLHLEVGFAEPYFKPILDGSHLNRAFTYVLEQNPHHGLEWDPLHEASNLPDLLGMREIGAYTAVNVRRHLPRVTRARLLGCLGLSALDPADGPPAQWVWAAVAAAGLVSLEGKAPRAIAAKQAIVALAGKQLSTAELGAMLGVSTRAIQRLRSSAADPRIVQAVRLQLGLIRHRGEAIQRLRLPFVSTIPSAPV
jgi:hypothetical protein